MLKGRVTSVTEQEQEQEQEHKKKGRVLVHILTISRDDEEDRYHPQISINQSKYMQYLQRKPKSMTCSCYLFQC